MRGSATLSFNKAGKIKFFGWRPSWVVSFRVTFSSQKSGKPFSMNTRYSQDVIFSSTSKLIQFPQGEACGQVSRSVSQCFLVCLQTLQEKFDKHPEVTHAKVEQERLLDELERYRTFFDFGEREVLLQEIQQLRNHLQTHLECGTLGAKHRRLSLTSKALRGSTADLSKSTALCTLPEATSSCGLNAVEHLEGQLWEKEQMEWEEREIELLTIVEDLREEADSYKQLSERRKLELDGEKR